MNELKIFENQHFGKIRTVLQDGEPWFVAADVCKALDIDPTATRRLDDDEKNTLRLTQGTSGNPNVTTVSESGLYSLVLGSRKPEARTFKRWITHEVIPVIRKHGGYLTPQKLEEVLLNPDTLIQLANNLKDEQEKNRRLTDHIEKTKPKVLFAESVECSHSEILVGELAKILKQNGVEIGQNRLFDRMRKDGYLISRKGSDYNMPTQKSMELGLLRIKETPIMHADGHVTVNKTPKVTGKGQVYFVNRYAGAEQAS